jgi:hypothetical protein
MTEQEVLHNEKLEFHTKDEKKVSDILGREQQDLLYSPEWHAVQTLYQQGHEPLSLMKALCNQIEAQKEIIRVYFNQTNKK